jgi:hypothetical protein
MKSILKKTETQIILSYFKCLFELLKVKHKPDVRSGTGTRGRMWESRGRRGTPAGR